MGPPSNRRRFRFAFCFVAILLFGAVLATTDDEVVLEDDDGFDGEAASVAASSLDDEFDVKYLTPTLDGDYHFAEHFDNVDTAKGRWIISRAHKEEQDSVFKYEGKWDFEFPQKRLFPTDKALVLKTKAKHHAISAKLDKPFEFKDKPFILQYEVNFQNGMDCGGAYVKLLTHSRDMSLGTFNDRTPYTIMFGPDKCGSDVKMHFIFRHKNPINGTFSEKHSKRPSNRMEETYTDKKPHVYRLKITPDNKFEVFVDGRLINQGSLLDDMEPKVNPPMDIEDPNDAKPADWDEREKIPDTTAKKPEDWDDEAPLKIPDPKASPPSGWLEDEPEMVPDPDASKPEDWDEKMDGNWEPPLLNNPKCVAAPGCGPWTAPLVENPNFKGKWKAPMISNPDYRGKWTRSKIPNPDYFEDKEPFKMSPIGAIGLELWTMSDLILFDNFIISSDEAVIEDWTSQTWELKRRIFDRDNEGVIRRLINYSNAHPWLWAIYVFVIGLPLVLIFTYCCGSDKKAADAQNKKTDEQTVDDVADEPEQQSKSPPRASPDTKSKSPVSKDDLEEAEEEVVEEDDAELEPIATSEEEESESEKEEVEEVIEEPVVEEEEEELVTITTSRRRKPRRE